MNEEFLSWEGIEYHHWDKSSDWYWSLGIISVSLAILFIIFGNILFALFVLVAAATGGYYASRDPKVAHIELNRRGVKVDSYFYTYESLDSFWIEEEDHHSKILIKSHKFFMPYIIVPLGDIHPDHVRDYLLQYLKEVEHHESFGHKMLEYFGF